jgi:RHH-type proline utilization regulon transcriptional repressor/proline dehydrogenase/delta 1-pyrroline-5-carboxylate dehydrogenase
MNSYQYHARHKFKMELDLFHLRGQDNTIRYLPIEKSIIRVHPADSLFEILARIAAAQAAGCKVTVSIPDNLESSIIAFLKKRERRELFLHRVKITEQSDDQLIAALNPGDRIRYAGTGRVPQQVYQAAAELGLYIAANPVFMEGRIELLNYYRSQSICHNYHRYGNLGARAFDQSLNAIRPFKV